MFYKMSSNFSIYFPLIIFLLVVTPTNAQSGTQIAISVDAGVGLIYLLLIVFFATNFLTPVARYIYVTFLADLVDKASKELVRQQRKITERLSDAGRKVSQSVRSV